MSKMFYYKNVCSKQAGTCFFNTKNVCSKQAGISIQYESIRTFLDLFGLGDIGTFFTFGPIANYAVVQFWESLAD